MRFLLILAANFFFSNAFSQAVIDVDKSNGLPSDALFDVNGAPLLTYRYVRIVEGSPYFTDQWMPAVTISTKGTRSKVYPMKIDLVANEIHFLDEHGQEMLCTIPVKEVQFSDSATKKTYRFLEASQASLPAGASRKGWYMPLVEGKATLYRVVKKTVQESKPYNSSVTEQRVKTADQFFISFNGNWLNVKKTKDLPEVLGVQKEAIQSFLKTDAVTKAPNNAEALSALVAYFNTLN